MGLFVELVPLGDTVFPTSLFCTIYIYTVCRIKEDEQYLIKTTVWVSGPTVWTTISLRNLLHGLSRKAAACNDQFGQTTPSNLG
jgi:hypothetical protein